MRRIAYGDREAEIHAAAEGRALGALEEWSVHS
jgi:hypothetical protein